jgi:hypothetical protein
VITFKNQANPFPPECNPSSRSKTALFFSILVLIFIVQGCAARASYQFVNESQRPSEYGRFFEELDGAVYRSGNRNGAYFTVAGFPYLRADRFLVSLKDRLEDDARKDQWVRLMQQRDLAARKTEIQTLPAAEVETLAAAFGFRPERGILLAKAISYSNKLLAHDQMRSDFYEVLLAAVQDSDEYSALMRIFGLYPVAAIPVAIVTHNVFSEIAEWHQQPPDALQTLGTLTAFGPSETLEFSGKTAGEILKRSAQNPLATPLPSVVDSKALALMFAPVIIQDLAADYDRPGAMVWSDTKLEIDPGDPRAYYYFTHAYYKNEPVLQINYVFWYSARGGPNSPLIERGPIDGLTIRVSLAGSGMPFMVDMMNNCGCYHFFVPRKEKVKQILPSPLAIDAFVPAWLPDDFPQKRLTIRIVSGWHQVVNVGARKFPVDFTPYRLAPYRRLEMLPKNGTHHESMFTARGIGKHSERIESDIFIPMGVPQVGRMRQRGHHAIKFVGRAHFDDPHLFDNHFEFK